MPQTIAHSGQAPVGGGWPGHDAGSDGGTPAVSRRFTTRHLSMMALGSAIGAGFFLGTGQSVSLAGPAALISYLIAALIAVSVMYALAELAAALPSTGSFSTYAEAAIGRWAGFTVGWMYWFTLVMVLGMEVTGAAQIFVGWFPAVPQWVVALVIVIVLGGLNLMAAGNFGEVEAWLAAVKVVAIVVFLLVGLGLVVGIIPGRQASPSQVVLGNGGFAPTGIPGIIAGLLAVITSFGGIEIVTIAAAEAEDARTAIGRALRSVIWRILVFYVGSVALLICLLPWNSEEMSGVPFAAVLNMAGIPAVGTIMNAIVFIALVSAFSANIYASSRMAYSLAARGLGPWWLLGRDAATDSAEPAALVEGKIEGVEPSRDAQVIVAGEGSRGDIAAGRTPKRAVWVSIVLALVSVGLNWYLPETLLGILINAIGMALLIVWAFIIVSQMRLHRSLEGSEKLSIRMPGGTRVGAIVLVALAIMCVLMAFSPAARPQLLAMLGLTAVVVAIYFISHWSARARKRSRSTH